MTAPYRTSEVPRPWPIHIVTVIIATVIALGIDAVIDGPPYMALAMGLAIVAFAVGFDVALCRAITIDHEGFSIGRRRYAWTDVECIEAREVPLARAGIFVKLTDEARARLGLRPARYKYYGFGLEPAPTPEDAAERFDIFIRAHRERLEEIYALMSMRELGALTRQTDVLLAKVSAGNVQARLVIDALEALTVEVVATSLDALLADEGRAIGTVLPDVARWDPTFTGGVMMLVGPMELAGDPRAQSLLAQYKDLVRKQFAGTPRAIEAIFAARRL